MSVSSAHHPAWVVSRNEITKGTAQQQLDARAVPECVEDGRADHVLQRLHVAVHEQLLHCTRAATTGVDAGCEPFHGGRARFAAPRTSSALYDGGVAAPFWGIGSVSSA